MAGVLAHDETGPCRVLGPHSQARAEVALGNPQLPRLRAVQQRRNQSTLTLVYVLSDHDVDNQAAVGIVDHQRLLRERRQVDDMRMLWLRRSPGLRCCDTSSLAAR